PASTPRPPRHPRPIKFPRECLPVGQKMFCPMRTRIGPGPIDVAMLPWTSELARTGCTIVMGELRGRFGGCNHASYDLYPEPVALRSALDDSRPKIAKPFSAE